MGYSAEKLWRCGNAPPFVPFVFSSPPGAAYVGPSDGGWEAEERLLRHSSYQEYRCDTLDSRGKIMFSNALLISFQNRTYILYNWK